MARVVLSDRMRGAGAAGFLAIVSIVFVSPIFLHPSNFGILDWDYNLFLQGVPRTTIVEYGQLPLWNPYEWGGIPMLGTQASRVLSPSFALTLAFGTVLGAKLDVWLHLLIGLSGTYVLAREHALGRGATIFAACAYLCSGWFSMVVASGMAVLLGVVFFPWALFARMRARHDSRFIPVLGALGTLIFFDGSAEGLAMLVVALALHETVDIVAHGRPLRSSVAVVLGSSATFIGLSAIKLFPALEILWRRPRWPSYAGGYSVDAFVRGMLQRGQTLHTAFPEGTSFWRGTTFGMDEMGAYVGIGILALALLGLGRRHHRLTAHLASLVLFVWMAFGNRAPFGPWRLLHAVPPFAFMRVPERFRFIFLLDLALFAGLGFDALSALLARARVPAVLSPRNTRAVLALVGSTAMLDPVLASRAVLHDAFSIPPVHEPSRDHFVQIERLQGYDARGFRPREELAELAALSSLYPALLAGVGSVRGFDPIVPSKRLHVRVLGAPNYVGEEWLTGTAGSVRLVRWTPNALTFDVTTSSDDRLVVNQAFDPGWRSSGDRAPVSENGLLAVPISAGKRRVELSYLPSSVVAGAFTSGAALLVLGWFGFRLYRESRNRRSIICMPSRGPGAER